ncbi:MAG TPA: hypothetical protein GX743_08255 [Actinomycetales bacterium]|nr:hypothetical protein [Actinomycetales bacterium]
MRISRTLRLGAGLAAGLIVVSAGAASAHHCYKDEWSQAAYQHHLAGGTAWVSLSDMGRMFMIPPELQEACGYVADDAVGAFMANRGMTQEPLIHSKATTGSGAFYNRGIAPKPFSYLSEGDFMELTLDLESRLAVCAESGE